MTPRRTPARITLALLAALWLPAAATQWSLQQSGFDGGGLLGGSFAGTDLNGDGWLSSADGEIATFQASYGGGANVGAFTLGPGDLVALVYRIGDPALGDDPGPPAAEGLYAASASFTLLAGIGAAGAGGGFAIDLVSGGQDAATASLAVTAVPEPPALALMAGGVAGLALALRRRRAKQDRA